MAYTRYHNPWVDADSATGGGDESTPLIAAALDHIETGIFDAAADADAAQVTADAAIPEPTPTTNGPVYWDGGEWVSDTIADAQIASGADIAVDKLAAAGTDGYVLLTKSGVPTWDGLVGVRANRTATQALSTSTETLVLFNAADSYDTDAFHDTSTNSSRLTVPTGLGGIYIITGGLRFANNATGVRGMSVLKNGSKIAEVTVTPGSSQAAALAIATAEKLAAGDYVELRGYQDSGGSLNIDPTLAPCHFEMHRLGVE
jgi:hypothetical protein